MKGYSEQLDQAKKEIKLKNLREELQAVDALKQVYEHMYKKLQKELKQLQKDNNLDLFSQTKTRFMRAKQQKEFLQ